MTNLQHRSRYVWDLCVRGIPDGQSRVLEIRQSRLKETSIGSTNMDRRR